MHSVSVTMSAMLVFMFGAFLQATLAQNVPTTTIVVNGMTKVAETDENFVCATIDWWPHDKCNYNRCPWGYSSATNLDLSRPFLIKAIQAFKSLRLRIGGSLQDQVVYDIGDLASPCHPFRKMDDGLFGFSKGCLHMDRWDELNSFFAKTGAVVTFGLNALYGRHQVKKGVWGGEWNSTNANNFMSYTASKRYQIDSWEFGNELSGSGIGASVGAEQYGKDIIKLKGMIEELYTKSSSKPAVVAPGGFFDKEWYTKLLQVTGPNVVNIMTHHIYNLGPGIDPNLVNKILDPQYLNKVSKTFDNLKQTLETSGPWAAAWVGESGGAFNSGGRHVSNTFVNSFWYLDQLGMASQYNTKVYCRQTLVGGNYGLLNTTTLLPNPDYFSALLWHRLMGEGVLAATSSAPPYLRTYAHCTKGRPGVTLLVINLSNQTDFTVRVENSMSMKVKGIHREGSIMQGLKRTVSWVGSKATDKVVMREEYHLTAEDGVLTSQTMFLNGAPLQLTIDGDVPSLSPVQRDVKSPVYIAPLSMAFIVLPNFDAPGCVTV